MPAVIVFNSTERVEVRQSAETVIFDLAESTTGFAGFEYEDRPQETVWVNREAVQMILDRP